jgi:CBS-domain-containing membrane protein
MQADLLQFILGDDAQRVDFNRARIESDLAEWNKLFEVTGRRLKTIYRKIEYEDKS